MPEEFSKIELDEPEDLDHVVSAIESHAIRLVKAQLEREKGTIGASAETEAVCRKVVEQVGPFPKESYRGKMRKW